MAANESAFFVKLRLGSSAINRTIEAYCGTSSSLSPVSGGGISACFGSTVFPAIPLSIAAFAFVGIWGDKSWKTKKSKGLKANKQNKRKESAAEYPDDTYLGGSPAPHFVGQNVRNVQMAICGLGILAHIIAALAMAPPIGMHRAVSCLSYALLWAAYLYHVWRGGRAKGVALSGAVTYSAAALAVVAIMPFAGNGNNEWFDLGSPSGVVAFVIYIVNVTLAVAFLATLWWQKRLSRQRGYSQEQVEPLDSWHQWDRVKLVCEYVWPVNQVTLQARVVFCLILLVMGRFVNVAVPLVYKRLIGALGTGAFPLDIVALYAAALFVQGGGGNSNGIVSNLRSYIWIPVGQNTDKSLKVGLYDHLLHLPLAWHLQRKTGEVFRSMDRGTDSIANLLTTILFNFIPAVADIAIAVVYFAVAFDALFGVIVLYTMVAFLVWTIVVSDFRTGYRKKQNEKDKAARGVSVDAMLNFETVKYFGNEDYEARRYAAVLDEGQHEEYKSGAGNVTLNIGQSVILSAGGLLGMLLCAYRVGLGHFAPGDFVLFVTYMAQLASPLTGFGNYWRQIQTYLVDANNMFELLEHKGDVNDVLGARPLNITRGAEACSNLKRSKKLMNIAWDGGVEFRNVSFSYGGRLILDDISFVIPAHKTYALVGESGGGKSTIIRLLFRFYDVTSGAVLIDGQNVAMVTQKSLRQMIGVVPQDTVLFHDTVKYNIRYGHLGATDDEVYEAARAAELHDRILTFEEGYETVVGERGLRLSGGEKQRVAIARTMLKAPAIVLLDEATSALDTNTEKNIQASLNRVCANRTTLIVAHRLSTIIHADCIMVVDKGRIIERGSHDELLASRGSYAAMWEKQQRKEHDSGDPSIT